MLFSPQIVGAPRLLLPNLLSQPFAFDNAAWTKVASSISANATTDPAGGATADTHIEDSGGGVHRVHQSITKAASALRYTFGVYAKAASGSRRLVAVLQDSGTTNGVFCVFDIPGAQVAVVATAFGSNWSGGTASVSLAGDGWILCRLAGVTSDTSTTVRAEFELDNGTGTGALSNSYTGDNASGLHLWDASLFVAS